MKLKELSIGMFVKFQLRSETTYGAIKDIRLYHGKHGDCWQVLVKWDISFIGNQSIWISPSELAPLGEGDI